MRKRQLFNLGAFRGWSKAGYSELSAGHVHQVLPAPRNWTGMRSKACAFGGREACCIAHSPLSPCSCTVLCASPTGSSGSG
eukprot:9260388-Alexandrium_andersonii.AAC.1